jgi:hypothetical protein
MNSTLADPNLMLMELAADCSKDPLAFAKAFWPWESDKLPSTGPRAWQTEIMEYIGAFLCNPENKSNPCRVAVSSGHGIGKSAFLGMLIHWAMSTCAGCKVVVTAGTGTQLSTKTVPEVSKWFKMSLGARWFDVHATSIKSLQTSNPELWRTDFVTWSAHNTEPFAGLHNKGKRILLVFDEASAIEDKVWEVAEGAMTDEDTEIIFMAFGNPTHNTGRFRECFGKMKHRWKTFQIDSRTVEGTNKEQLTKWVEDYGEDSDFVRVRVRGEFPRAGSTQLIPSDVVESCRKYKAEAYSALPKILSVDVARFGDDQTVIGVRQGRKFSILKKFRGLDTVQVAERVIEIISEEEPDATVIDADGIGAGVVDHLRYRGWNKRIFEFHGGEAAKDTASYYNRRAEVWGLMRDALKANMEIPDDPELADDLTEPQYGFSAKQQIQLEKKEDMKKRGKASPDCGDCLAMTFAVNVAAPKPKPKPVEMYAGQNDQGWLGA